MKKILATIIILLALLVLFFVIAKRQLQPQPIASIGLGTLIADATYMCDDYKAIRAKYYPEWAELTLSDGRILTIAQAQSASGARYVDNEKSLIFWNKGKEAFLEEGGETTYIHCREEDDTTNVSTQTETKAAVTTLELVEDSRCPSNANCIQAGTVRVKVRVVRGNVAEIDTLTLNEPKIIAGTGVTLTSVSPEPFAGAPLTFKDYKFTFVIE